MRHPDVFEIDFHVARRVSVSAISAPLEARKDGRCTCCSHWRELARKEGPQIARQIAEPESAAGHEKRLVSGPLCRVPADSQAPRVPEEAGASGLGFQNSQSFLAIPAARSASPPDISSRAAIFITLKFSSSSVIAQAMLMLGSIA